MVPLFLRAFDLNENPTLEPPNRSRYLDMFFNGIQSVINDHTACDV
jgi:hypothetical protein